MNDFSRYVCWNEETVAATISTEAVSPSPNVFLSTHAPLDIHRTTLFSGQPGATRVVTERDVFADFVNRPTNMGVLVMPVLGESGAGKSHLVRWVHAQATSELSEDRYRVVYLPKDGTSLAGVVERLLMSQEGPQFDEIRTDLRRLGHSVTHEALQHDILDKLAAALLVASPASPRERALVGEFGLRALLVDPFVRPKILRPDGLVARRAEHILQGRGEAGGDIPMGFSAEDLPLDMVDIGKASEPAQRIYRQLASSETLQATALTMLAHHLDVAVMEATNLGVGRVAKAFLDIRRSLAGSHEIVLLVEDFALVQGVQRDLIDAITETGERRGEQSLAPIRTLMAVTSGYFQDLPPTARTRIDAATPYRYELRVDLDGEGAEERVIDLMGRYLNAARVGRVVLDAADVQSADSVPNACDSCPYRAECHAGFGASSDGFGLYPYNRPALLRALRATTPPDRPKEFNPRAGLARAVRSVLQEHAVDIRRGTFPNEDFEQHFPRRLTGSVVSTSVQADINRADPQDASRRQVLLQYWGDAPSRLINLPGPVHAAFALPALVDLVARGHSGELVEESPRRPEGPLDQPARIGKLERKLSLIEDWQARSGPMPTEEAGDIRRAIREAVFSAVSWTDPLMKEPGAELLEKAWPKQQMARVVSIQGASETIAHGVTPLMQFERTPENALFFSGLVKLAGGRRDGTLAAALRLREIAVRYAPTARSAVIVAAERGDEAVVAALRVSLTGAALAGVVVPGDAPEALLSAAVARLNNYQRSDTNARDALWMRVLSGHLAERGELVVGIREAIGTAQGTGGAVHAIDASRALRLIAVAAQNWEPGGDVPRWAKKAARPLANGKVEAVVNAQIDTLTELLRQIRLRLPEGTGLGATVKAVTSAFESAERAAMVPVPNLPQLRLRNLSALDFTSAPIDALERDLRMITTASAADRLRVAAFDRGSDLPRIRDYLAASESWLDAGLATPLSTPSEETKQLVDDLARARVRWAAITATFREAKA